MLILFKSFNYTSLKENAVPCLVPLPPGVVICLSRRIKDKLGAAVQGSLGPNIEQAIPDLNVRVLDVSARGRVQSEAVAVVSAGIDATSKSEAVVNKDLDQGTVNEDVHLDGFCACSVDLVRLEVAGQCCVGEHADLGGVEAVQDDGVLGRVVVDVRVFLAVGRGGNGDTCGAGGVLDHKLQFIGVAELSGQRELTGVVADSPAALSLGVMGATAQTFDDIAGWADTESAGGPAAIGALGVAGVAGGGVGRVVHNTAGVLDENLPGE